MSKDLMPPTPPAFDYDHPPYDEYDQEYSAIEAQPASNPPASDVWDAVLAQFMRGGNYGHYWQILPNRKKVTHWWKVGKQPPAPIEGDCYFGVFPVTHIPTHDDEGNPTEPKYLRSNGKIVQTINCLYGDFDQKDFDDDIAAVREYVSMLEPQPSLVVRSGGGEHVYWFLDEPFVIDSEEKRELVKHYIKAWVGFTKSDHTVNDLPRVLRVPGTYNRKAKYGSPSPLVTIRECDLSRTYSIEYLASFLPPMDAKPDYTPPSFVAEGARGRIAGWAKKGIENKLSEVASTLKGERNPTLRDASIRCFGLALAGGFSMDETESSLIQAGQQTGLSEKECRKVVITGRRKVETELGSAHIPPYLLEPATRPYVAEKDDKQHAIEAFAQWRENGTLPNDLEPCGKYTALLGELPTPAPKKKAARSNALHSLADNYPAEKEVITGAARLVDAPINRLDKDNPAPFAEAIKAAKPRILEYAGQGEKGDALLFADVYGGRVKWATIYKAHYLWQSPVWVKDETNLVPHIMGQYVRELFYDKGKSLQDQWYAAGGAANMTTNAPNGLKEQSDKCMKRVGQLAKANGVKNALTYASTDPRIAISGNEFDNQLSPEELPVRNGILNLKTKELRNAEPSDYLTVCAPTAYVEGAKAPRWEQFLLEIWQDLEPKERDEMVSFIKRLLGYGLEASNREGIFPVLWGAGGRNGKDVLISTLQTVLGEGMAGKVDKSVVLDLTKQGRGQPGGNVSPHLMRLKGKRFAWASEPDKESYITVGQVKDLTASPTVIARGLYKDDTEWKPTHLLMLITNPKPTVEMDEAIWDRLKLIPFNMKFLPLDEIEPGNPLHRVRDTSLFEKLKEEKEGILAWLVEGYQEYLRHGLQSPSCVKVATKEYKQESDWLANFIAEEIEVHPSFSDKGGLLYAKYKEWAGANGRKIESNPVFSQTLAARYPKTIHGGAAVYKGLRVRQLKMIAEREAEIDF